jgi:hypothetical protein
MQDSRNAGSFLSILACSMPPRMLVANFYTPHVQHCLCILSTERKSFFFLTTEQKSLCGLDLLNKQSQTTQGRMRWGWPRSVWLGWCEPGWFGKCTSSSRYENIASYAWHLPVLLGSVRLRVLKMHILVFLFTIHRLSFSP